MTGCIKGTSTIFFIKKDKVPQNRFIDVTCENIVCEYREVKSEPNRIRLTIGGNKINYPEDWGTPTADLLTIKLLLNSVISIPNAKFMTMDIKIFYFNTPLNWYEYLQLKSEDIP